MLEDATELRFDAERKGGEMLAAMDKAKGGRPEKTGSEPQPVSEPPATSRRLASPRPSRVSGRSWPS